MRKSMLKKIYKAATILTVVAVLAFAFYIMSNRLGLVDKLDFGAGSYYYADIPEFEKVIDTDSYNSKLSLPLAILLFLLWGALMYWLWKKIDR